MSFQFCCKVALVHCRRVFVDSDAQSPLGGWHCQLEVRPSACSWDQMKVLKLDNHLRLFFLLANNY